MSTLLKFFSSTLNGCKINVGKQNTVSSHFISPFQLTIQRNLTHAFFFLTPSPRYLNEFCADREGNKHFLFPPSVTFPHTTSPPPFIYTATILPLLSPPPHAPQARVLVQDPLSSCIQLCPAAALLRSPVPSRWHSGSAAGPGRLRGTVLAGKRPSVCLQTPFSSPG